MNDIDRKIQAALRRDKNDETPIDEPNLAEEIITVFRGRHRSLYILMTIVNLVFFAGAAWAAIRFYQADVISVQFQWAALAFLLLLAASFIKLWFWLEVQTNRVLREVKRVELLLVTRAPQENL